MISFDDFFNFVMAIFLIVFCIWFYSKFFKFVFKLLTFPFRLILAPFKFIKSIFTGPKYKNAPKNQQITSDTKQRPKKKMGFLKKLAIAGVTAHTARVAYNVANFTFPSFIINYMFFMTFCCFVYFRCVVMTFFTYISNI